MTSLPSKAYQRISIPLQRSSNNHRMVRLARQVQAIALERSGQPQAASLEKPVAFFNASTRLTGISLNAGFSLLASLGLQLAGVPVVRFTCQAGMSLCVLGTDRDVPSNPPPCRGCITQSRALFSDASAFPFTYQADATLSALLKDLSVDSLCQFESPSQDAAPQGSSNSTLPLGKLVQPSIRWVLRRHHLQDDEPTRYILQQYILSASHVARQFSAFLDKTRPHAVVLFNGQFFPEAIARWICLQRGIPAVTHEVGLLPFSTFFTTGEATAYPLSVPESFDLDESQNRRLDEYLSRRFQGQFSMAGIRFWPEMHGLSAEFLELSGRFGQVVPIFTNVIFDTSQPHSNVVFPHMFAWLDLVLDAIRAHPDTLFVLRAHPDESRPGKASRESVSQWVAQNQAEALPNLVFVDSDQSLSSYELIQRSRFVMVYNSTIGLEASILGIPVLCAGRARYTQLPTVFFPATQHEFHQQLESFLSANAIPLPLEYKLNARRFLYYQLFRSSLPFNDFLEQDNIWPGFVRLKKFDPLSLAPSASPAIRAIHKGIFEGGNFLLDGDG